MFWHDAFLEQAKSDWRTYEAIQDLSLDACQVLHYLQMATEKLGKAMLLAEGEKITKVRTSHKAFPRFLQIVSRNSEVQDDLQMSAQQLRSHIKNLLPLAEEIEKLAPAIAQDGPNAEYPWADPSGSIHTPASFHFSAMEKLSEPKGRKLLQLTRLLLERFNILFIPKHVQ
jgi:hypothetical protein